MDTLIQQLDRFCLYTDGVESIVSFYRKLGFEACDENDTPVLVGPRFLIKIHGPRSHAEPVPQNIAKGSIDLCFESHLAPEEIAHYLQQQDIPLRAGPVPRVGARGAMISFYIKDSEGNLIESSSYANQASAASQSLSSS